MPETKTPPTEINQTAIGDGIVQVAGDNNTVNIIQKVFKGINIFIGNVFRGDGETLDQRNRRILLNHVENFWVKGVLEKSLYGEVLIELGMKEEPEAVKTYPWGIKRENTGETLPAGMTMLEIFEQVGMGRSLLVLGAPGSGKTTMLLELARQLIECARKDASEPIPMVFNLASWTEKLTLAQWLAEQLNLIYYVPKKTAPDWVSGNKLLLLLDGLDEVRPESRAKCVQTINQFRQEHGLTSIALCSRSQDYADLRAKLSLDGAIEIQSLNQKQFLEFFGRFGNKMTSIQQAIEKDNDLREMAGTPLFLSIMTLAFRKKQDVEMLLTMDENAQRKHVFETYIQQMFTHAGRMKSKNYDPEKTMPWLAWLAQKMILHNTVPYFLENMQPNWISWVSQKKEKKDKIDPLLDHHYVDSVSSIAIISGMIIGLIVGFRDGLGLGLLAGLLGTIATMLFVMMITFLLIFSEIKLDNTFVINSQSLAKKSIMAGLGSVGTLGIATVLTVELYSRLGFSFSFTELFPPELLNFDFLRDFMVFIFISGWVMGGLQKKTISTIEYPGQRITIILINSFFVFLLPSLIWPLYCLFLAQIPDKISRSVATSSYEGIYLGMITGLMFWAISGGSEIIKHYALRVIISKNNLLPWKLIPFLDYCCDLIFLRRVGGGYIFIHRLLMEHFAEMYTEKYAPKESQ